MARNRQISASIQAPRIMLMLVTLGLILFGMVMVYSSSMVKAITAGDDPYYYVFKQLQYAGIGLIMAVLVWKLPVLKFFRSQLFNGGVWVFSLALIFLTALMGVGDESWGAQRWLAFGGFSLQPAEFIKVALILFSVFLYDEYRSGLSDLQTLTVKGLVMVLLPAFLIFRLQSDLGTTLVIAVGILAVAWLGEVPKRIIFAILAVGVALAVLSIVTSSYRMGRLIYLDPWNDGMNGRGDGWQIIHSYWAFSEGGIFGVGLGNSYEKYSYLPMAETDFIFAIIGEELGMVGCVAVMTAFCLFLVAGLRIAYNASDAFDMMAAGGLTVMLVFQAFLNMGCAVGVFPTTGKPLPFISAGGSSLIASMIMVGLILNVSDAASGPTEHDRRRDDLRVVHAVGGNIGSSSGGFSARRTNKNIPLGAAPVVPNRMGVQYQRR